jgi:Family of unknown function (DUF5652)
MYSMINQFFGMGAGGPAWMTALIPYLPLILVWEIFWKGLALWHSGRRGQPWWFVALLLINTFGILEIIYLFAVAKLKWSELFSKK